MEVSGRTAELLACDDDLSQMNSLAAVLARLSMDGRDFVRCRGDDSQSLDVNFDDACSCRLSDVSGVSSSSCLNDLGAMEDELAEASGSSVPGGDSDSEKDDEDDDEDEADGVEVEAMLLQRCLEAEVLERQRRTEGKLLQIASVDQPECSLSCDTTLDDIAAILDTPEPDVVDSDTIKRAPLRTDNSKDRGRLTPADAVVSRSNDDVTNVSVKSPLRSGSSVTLPRIGGKKNPDARLCAAMGDELKSNFGTARQGNGNLRNGTGSTPSGNHRDDTPSEPPASKRRISDYPGSSFSTRSISADNGFSSIVDGIPSDKRKVEKSGRVAVESNSVAKKSDHSKHITNGKDNPKIDFVPKVIATSESTNCASSDEDGLVALPTNRLNRCSGIPECGAITVGNSPGSSMESNQSAKFRKPPLAQSRGGKVSEDAMTDVPLGDVARTLSVETDGDSADAASVVSDDVEKVVTPITGTVFMPSVNDGLSSSDVSDVEEEALSMVVEVKRPTSSLRSSPRVPAVRTPTSLHENNLSRATSHNEMRTSSTSLDDRTPVVEEETPSFESAWVHMSTLQTASGDSHRDMTPGAGRLEAGHSGPGRLEASRRSSNSSNMSIGHVELERKTSSGDVSTTKSPNQKPSTSRVNNDDDTVDKIVAEAHSQSPINGNIQNEAKAQQPPYEAERESFLIEGVLFRARYLGSTQLISEGQPSKAVRMMQAQEAIGRIKQKASEQQQQQQQQQLSTATTSSSSSNTAAASQPSTLVDLFVSVEKIMVLNTDLQEIMMDHALRTISYIADIGDLLVVMARRGPVAASPSGTPGATTPGGSTGAGGTVASAHSHTKICCHVFESDEAQLIAQSISQAFQVAYMEFLKANGINDPDLMKEMDYQDVLSQQAIFGEELFLFSNKDMQKEIIIPKLKNEPLGVVIVESGWGSMVPTIVLASMAPGGAAARCGQLNIGDQIMSINGVSLVGLPLSTCQNYIKAVRSEILVRLLVVSCTPVVEVLVKRPDIKYQLGFSVQNGVICSLLRGGIAERGGVRVGHRIIEINGQSVVAVPHEKIVSMLATSVGEIHMKTMQTSIYRLLTGQDTPHYI